MPDSPTIMGISGPSNCELGSMVHNEIVMEAVSIALETSEEKRWQSQIIESLNVE